MIVTELQDLDTKSHMIILDKNEVEWLRVILSRYNKGLGSVTAELGPHQRGFSPDLLKALGGPTTKIML